MYDRYKESEEEKFREKYNFKYFVNDCIKLYKNPIGILWAKILLTKGMKNFNH